MRMYGPQRGGRAIAAMLALVGAGLVGCQSYQPAPFDPAEHRSEFLSRTPDGPGVAEFATRLAALEGRADVFDPADGYSLAEAEAVAMVLNAELRLARLRAGVTKAGAENAGLWEDPSLRVDVTRIVQSTPNPWKVFSSIGLTLPISGRLDVEKRRAGSEHGAELARVAESEWRTRIELRRAWARLAAAELRQQATREFLEQLSQVLSVVDAMEKGGEMSRSESRLFQVDAATSRAELAQQEAERESAVLEIKRLMGLSPQATLTLVTGTIGSIGDGGGREAGGAEALGERLSTLNTQNPALAISIAEYEVAERALELEIRKQYPDLAIGPGYGREDGQDQVLLGLNVPLPILNANRRGIAEALAAREAARGHVEATQEHLLSELARAQLELRSSETLRDTLERQIVPMVDAQYADVRQVARLGEVNTLLLLESLKRQHDAKARLIDVRLEEAKARIRIDELAGPAKLGPDSEAPQQHLFEKGAQP